MNQEIKEKWVAALRSGEYRQTQEVLRSDEGFCCLGVLCDLFAKDGTGRWNYIEPGKIGFYYGTFGDYDSTELPTSLRQDIGITDRQEDHLINMNDEEEKDFFAIADYIATL